MNDTMGYQADSTAVTTHSNWTAAI